MTRTIKNGLSLGTLHSSQVEAYWALKRYPLKALRCGRRWGKTDFAKTWIAQGLAQGYECAWFAPQHKTWSEVYAEIVSMIRPILDTSSKASAVMRMNTGGRLDFWTLENTIAGRGRRYHRIVIDEAAFTKDGDNKTDGSMMELWEKSIKPTLYDYGGEALVCSNTAGKNPENFFYNICTDEQYGFGHFHAATQDNPVLPKRLQNETAEAWRDRRAKILEDLRAGNDPLVYAQEHLAEFVDWAGVGFFAREKLLVNNEPVPFPVRCECVFAVIDTASKTGTEHDATAVTYFALERYGNPYPLMILDWDITQIEGALLETWLPTVFRRLDELAQQCQARRGSLGAMIEDKNSGTILLQQAVRRGMPARPINSKLTAMGKDERALNVSGYVFRGEVKYTDLAYNKMSPYKRRIKNHLVDQVESFRMGDKNSRRDDDLLDAFCYGIALSLGNSAGF